LHACRSTLEDPPRKAYCAEIDEHTYKMAVSRLEDQVRKARQQSLLLEHLIQYEVT
jgi:hypothetical protein